MINCDRCGADTVEKQLMSKKTGKPFTILECTNADCRSDKDPKYPYSFFPPKTDKVGGYGNNRSSGYAKPAAKSVIEAGVMAQLESLQAKVDRLIAKLGA